MYTKKCEYCGKEFNSQSTYRKACDDCRKIKKAECLKKFREKRKIDESKKVVYKKRKSLDERIEEIRAKKFVRTDIDCPNYNPTRVDCAMCSVCSWRYKSCGGTK